jgi:hypothetical protein
MTHPSIPEEEKIPSGLQPEPSACRSVWEDWHDIIANLEDALDVV